MTFDSDVTLDLLAINNLASTGGYAGLVNMSQQTAALLLSAAVWFSNTNNWVGASGAPTQSEKDQIDAITAEAIDQIMSSMIGTVIPVATQVLPPRTLLCDGATYNEADYPELYAALDPVFQISPTQFVVPDCRDRFIAGEFTGAMGLTGGAINYNIGTPQLPPHDHDYLAGTPTVATLGAGAPLTVAAAPPITLQTSQTGAGNTLQIIPPFIILAFAIIAGRP